MRASSAIWSSVSRSRTLWRPGGLQPCDLPDGTRALYPLGYRGAGAKRLALVAGLSRPTANELTS